MNFALVMPVLVLCAGLAVDAGYAQWQKKMAQNAADAAAVGALIERTRGGASWAAAGQADAALNGFTNGQHGVTVTVVSPPTSGVYNGDATAIQATVQRVTPTIFMGFFHILSVNVLAQAVVATGSSTNCLYSLNASLSRSVVVGGNSSITSGCGIYVNSSASEALHSDGGGTVQASSINVVGGASCNGCTPAPTTSVAVQSDPLAWLQQPCFSSCTYTNFKLDSSTGSQTLTPGTYCGGITISSTVTATLQPGLYIVTGGVNWNGQSNVRGSGVTLFFTQGGGWSYGQVTISGQVNVNLSAPTTNSNGALAGVLMFGDRAWNNTAQNVSINGGSSTKFEGVLYFPTTGVIFTGNTTSNGNYFGLVADNVSVNGGATVTMPTPDYSSISGGSPFHGGRTGLVE